MDKKSKKKKKNNNNSGGSGKAISSMSSSSSNSNSTDSASSGVVVASSFFSYGPFHFKTRLSFSLALLFVGSLCVFLYSSAYSIFATRDLFSTLSVYASGVTAGASLLSARIFHYFRESGKMKAAAPLLKISLAFFDLGIFATLAMIGPQAIFPLLAGEGFHSNLYLAIAVCVFAVIFRISVRLLNSEPSSGFNLIPVEPVSFHSSPPEQMNPLRGDKAGAGEEEEKEAKDPSWAKREIAENRSSRSLVESETAVQKLSEIQSEISALKQEIRVLAMGLSVQGRNPGNLVIAFGGEAVPRIVEQVQGRLVEEESAAATKRRSLKRVRKTTTSAGESTSISATSNTSTSNTTTSTTRRKKRASVVEPAIASTSVSVPREPFIHGSNQAEIAATTVATAEEVPLSPDPDTLLSREDAQVPDSALDNPWAMVLSRRAQARTMNRRTSG